MDDDEGIREIEAVIERRILRLWPNPAHIVDEVLAKMSPCTCVKIDAKDLCWSRGGMGFLSPAQEELYCPTKEYVERPGITEHVREFREAARVAHRKIEHLPKGQRLRPWLNEMSTELKRRGLEL